MCCKMNWYIISFYDWIILHCTDRLLFNLFVSFGHSSCCHFFGCHKECCWRHLCTGCVCVRARVCVCVYSLFGLWILPPNSSETFVSKPRHGIGLGFVLTQNPWQWWFSIVLVGLWEEFSGSHRAHGLHAGVRSSCCPTWTSTPFLPMGLKSLAPSC